MDAQGAGNGYPGMFFTGARPVCTSFRCFRVNRLCDVGLRSRNADLLEKFSKRQFTKYAGHSTSKSQQTDAG